MNTRRSARKRTIGAMVAVTLAVSLAACGDSSDEKSGGGSGAAVGAGGSNVIKIATVGDFSGVNSVLSVSLRDGVRAWAQEVNAKGGVGGHKIRLVEADVAANPAKAASAVRDLVQNQKVVALVGVDTPSTQESWAKYATSVGLPIIGGNGATDSWATQPNMYTVSPTLTVKYKVFGQTMVRLKKSKLAVFYCAEIASCAAAPKLFGKGGAAYVDGVQLVSSAAVSSSAPDYTSQCLGAKDAGAEVGELSMSQTAAVRLAEACAKQGFKPIWLQPGSVYGEATQTANFEGGVVEDSFFLLDQDNAGVKRFKAAMAKYAPNAKLNGSTSSGWTAGLLFEHIMGDLPKNPTSADVIKAMNSVRNETYGILPQPVTFEPGKGHQTTNCQWVGTWNDAKKALVPLAKPVCV